nr:heavy metal-associated isoprenylated plant protein 32-like [Ipomoea batatas]GMC75064.1 heavy metal-associated isoprenylated plant protein 32-like [Ipomoea batatas]
MEPKAEADCVLIVDVQCDECKMKLMEVLSSILGVYSVTIDAEQGIAKVAGEVEPNALLRALSRSGKHAELVYASSSPPYIQRGYGNGYNAIEDSCARELPEHSLGYDYTDNNYSGGYLPPAQYLPLVEEYNDAASTSLCAIM